MNTGILQIAEQLKDAYEGDPWFGRPVKSLLSEADESIAFRQPSGGHSILELVWHMITWREFAVDRLRHSPQMQLEYFEKNDWRLLDHSDTSLWKGALERLEETQAELLAVLQQQEDALLDQIVPERRYNYRKLLCGIIQHDIYHAGQVAYLVKTMKANVVMR